MTEKKIEGRMYFVANKEQVTVDNVAALCMTLMVMNEDRYRYFKDLWRDLEEAMGQGGHMVDFGKDMGDVIARRVG